MSFVVPDDTVLVADGGLATELEARGNDLSDPLWSARLLLDAPDQITDAHLAFSGRSGYSAAQPRQWIAAGASIVGGCCRVRPADIAAIAQAAS